eukprot:1161442-Pelagomonas_calceolata.AAC.4
MAELGPSAFVMVETCSSRGVRHTVASIGVTQVVSVSLRVSLRLEEPRPRGAGHSWEIVVRNLPDGTKKAYVRLTSDYDALDVANKIGII